MKKATITETIVVLYAILFLYAGISKLIDYPVFKEQLATSSFLASFASLLVILLPLTEFAIVILLIVPPWRLIGFCACIGLMAIFTIYIIAILAFSNNIPCSCGGILEELSWGQHIVLNSVFIVLGLVGLITQRKIQQKAHSTEPSRFHLQLDEP